MVDKSALPPGRGPSRPAAGPSLAQWVESLGAALEDAQACLAAGEAGEAEKRAKAVCACARAARDIAELEAAARAQEPEEDEEALREELRRRLVEYIIEDQEGGDLRELERIRAAPSAD